MVSRETSMEDVISSIIDVQRALLNLQGAQNNFVTKVDKMERIIGTYRLQEFNEGYDLTRALDLGFKYENLIRNKVLSPTEDPENDALAFSNLIDNDMIARTMAILALMAAEAPKILPKK